MRPQLTWRKAASLAWAAITIVFAWTWVYAWASVESAFQETWTRLAHRNTPLWLIATWRVGITIVWTAATIFLAWAWWRPRERPILLTRDGWGAENRLRWLSFARLGDSRPARRIWLWIKSWWHPPDLDRMVEIGENEGLKEAYNWADNYSPERNGDVYDPVLSYAQKSYDEMVEIADNLDKKADDLMKISGAVGAALAAAGRISGASTVLASPLVLVAIGCLVFTMLVCARSRKPMRKVVPLTVRAAIEVVEQSALPPVPLENGAPEAEAPEDESVQAPRLVHPTGFQVKAVIAASYHWAIVGTQFVIEWKATQISRATFLFCLGLILLVSGFLRPFG